MRFGGGLFIVLTLLQVLVVAEMSEGQDRTCERWIAKAVSVEGRVESLRKGETLWHPVRRDDTFCAGDTVRVSRLSRAEILLSNQATVRLDQETTLSLEGQEDGRGLLMDLRQGAAHFFSRIRRGLTIRTPSVNAMVRGTEFFIRADVQETFMTVFEGDVMVENAAGGISLGRGQSMSARPGEMPGLRVVLRPRDAVHWTLYYPPVLYPARSFLDQWIGARASAISEALGAYRRGDRETALALLEEVAARDDHPGIRNLRAAIFLSAGRVEEAGREIGRALALSAEDSDSLALQSVIRLAGNDRAGALDFAERAARSPRVSAAAFISLSYARQSYGDLAQALAALEEAVRIDSRNAFAWARLSEVRLSLGETDGSLRAAEEAVRIDPHLSRTQTVLGFAYLLRIKTAQAREAFEYAVSLDQADPLPRIGMGLAFIREGDFPAGREQMEIAAGLDPLASVTRSYLGKAYYEEKRDDEAVTQLGIAKETDPLDPTPWFYDAVRKQSVNRPVEALRDIQESIARNDNRSVYRSRLLLDEDLAARSANLARIYQDIGFDQAALAEGWKSVSTDPASFSAHRFLSDTYAALPRHEIARVSELLQAQFLQPLNVTPLPPHLAESNLLILSEAGPAAPSYNEFNPLFNRNRVALQLNGIAGGQQTMGEEIVLSGVRDNVSFSIGQFHYKTDGFRDNNDLLNDLFNAFVQVQVSPRTSLLGEVRYTVNERGDRKLNYFPDDYMPNLRLRDEVGSFRAGVRHTLSPGSDILGTFVYQSADRRLHDINPFASFDVDADESGYMIEVQHLYRAGRFRSAAGAGFFRTDYRDTFTDAFFDTGDVYVTRDKRTITHAEGYFYGYLNPARDLTLTIGLSGDVIDGAIRNRSQINPKAGLIWNPLPSTTVRMAAFRTLKRSLINNQTLEPTQVAGFNQFFDDAEVTDSWRYGVGIDQRFSKVLLGGFEMSGRRLSVPYMSFAPAEPPDAPVQEVKTTDWKERSARAYLYWAPHTYLALTAEYLYERFDRDPEFIAGIEKVTTHRFPLGIAFVHPSGLALRARATYYDQRGWFLPNWMPPGSASMEGADRFWIVDAALSYRMPMRLGLLTIGVKNLFDETFLYQDTDPSNPAIQPKRLVYAKLTLSF